jgi:hypothetical protein
MHIAKPIRVFGYMAISFTLSALTYAVTKPYIGVGGLVLAVVLWPIYNIVGGSPIDAFDFWLRRKTRDPIWLISHAGRQWLDTDEGREWAKQTGHQR